MALIFLLLPLLLSSLVVIGDELACLREKAEAPVFGLLSCMGAPTLAFLVYPPFSWSLVVAREVLAHRRGKAEVLMFDLAVVAKALVQFEHSSEVLVFDLGASPAFIV
jgi:hypothetical protein